MSPKEKNEPKAIDLQALEGRASFSPTEIAARNGIGRNTVYVAIRDGKLRAVTVGARRTMRVSLEAEAEWLNGGSKAAA